MRLMDGAAVVAAAMWLAPAAVSAQTPAQAPVLVNARVEVSAALAGSSATVEAIERQAALQDRVRQQEIAAQQQEIAALQARLVEAGARGTAEVAGLELQLAEAREAFVADLARRDQAYATEIEVIRRQANDIASTPEGAAALRVYNSGDRFGAVAILDRLRRASDAGQARQIATLARDALESGDPRFDTAGVIARYEEVTRLDPGVRDDWYQLFWLYLSAQKSAEALAAAGQLDALATDDPERSEAHILTAGILMVRRDTDGALVQYQRSIEILERLSEDEPDSGVVSFKLNTLLGRVADLLTKIGDVDAASAHREAQSAQTQRWREVEERRLIDAGLSGNYSDFDVEFEVAFAVARSSATSEAIEQLTVPEVRVRVNRISSLEVRLFEEISKNIADEVEIKNIKSMLMIERVALVELLSSLDSDYALDISQFRLTMIQMASTREGLAGLSRFNRRESFSVISTLDELDQTQKIREFVRYIEFAQDLHRIAELATEACSRGFMIPVPLFNYYLAPARIDPGNPAYWSRLAALYGVSGRCPEPPAG